MMRKFHNYVKLSTAIIIALLPLLLFTGCYVIPSSTNNSTNNSKISEPTPIPTEQYDSPEPEISEMLSMGDTGTFNDLNVFIKSSEVIELKAVDNIPVKVIELKASVKNIGKKVGGITSLETLCYDPDGIYVKENPVLDYPDVYFGNGRDNMLTGAVKDGSFYIEYTKDGVYRVYFRAVGNIVLGFNIDVKENNKIQSDKTAEFDENIKIQYPEKLISSGDTFEFNKLQFLVNSIDLKEDSGKNKVVAINVEIKNAGKEKYGLNIVNRSFFGPDGIQIHDSPLIRSINNFDIEKDKSVTGDLVFKYAGEGIYTIVFSDIGKNFEGTGETIIVGVNVKMP